MSMDGYDDMVGLSGYLTEFSMKGSLPTSLDAAPPAPAPETKAPYVPILEKAGVRYVATPVTTVQTYLNLLQANAGNSGKLDAKTKTAFAKWAKVFKEARQTALIPVKMEDTQSLEPTLAKRMKLNPGFTFMHPDVLSRMRVLANKAAAAGAKAPLSAPAAPKATTPSALDMTASTDDVQGILKRLGASPDRLSDGLFGRTTKGFWQDAAKKRGVNPSIAAKSGARLKQVMVNKNAYLTIKADADAKMPPSPGAQEAEPIGGGLKTMGQALIQGVTREELTILVDRLVPGAGKLVSRYESVASKLGVDSRIEADGERFLVLKTSLGAVTKAFLAAAPKKPPPGPQLSAMERQIASIVKGSTSSVTISTLRTAIRGIPDASAATIGPWSPDLRAYVMQLLTITGPSASAWENALVPGKLVSADGKTLKLPAAQADSIKALAARFKKAKVAVVDRFKNFTKVNAAEVIARINGLGITAQKFDRAGGPKELADAIKTFLQQSNKPVPSGDLVRTDAQKNTYVKNSVMTALASAVVAAQQRAASTKTFRDRMVANAIKEASASLPVTSFQQALKHLVLTKQAGKNAVLYNKMKITGAFDTSTRAAFTEVTRSRTIGPAVQEYQRLLGSSGRTTAQVNALVLEARNQVWNAFLDETVKKRDGKLTMAVIPSIAVTLGATAALYQKNVSADVRHQEEVAAQMRTLADAVRKSTAVVSILNLQQALSQMSADKEIVATPGLKISGSSDKATRDGLFKLSSLIFPEGLSVPETMWAAYLKKVGYLIISGQPPKREWIGANYISLPVALADRVATRAGEWIARHGASMVKVVAFKHPSVVIARVPAPKKVVITEKEAAKKVVESPAPAATTGAVEQAAALKAAQEAATQERTARLAAEQKASDVRKVAELAAQRKSTEALAAQRASVAAATAQKTQHAAELREQQAKAAGDIRAAQKAAAEAKQAAAMAASQVAEAQAAQGRAIEAGQDQQAAEARGGGAQVTGPSITGPTIKIDVAAPLPAPLPVMKAGMGGGMIAAVLGAGVGLALLLKGGGGQPGGRET